MLPRSTRTLTPTLSRFAVEGASEYDRSGGVPSTAKRERARVRVSSQHRCSLSRANVSSRRATLAAGTAAAAFAAAAGAGFLAGGRRLAELLDPTRAMLVMAHGDVGAHDRGQHF